MIETLEFSADPAKNGVVRVAVNISSNYDKKLKTYNRLYKILRAKIPFKFKVQNGPTVAILDGDARKGMAQVEVIVGYKVTDDEATKLLKEAGFTRFFWPSF